MTKCFNLVIGYFVLMVFCAFASSVHAETGKQSKGIGTQAPKLNETTEKEISYSPEDVKKGMKIFLGTRQLKNGGPACISCHSTSSIKTPGGNLGPDLTKAADRMGGGEGLMAWLSASASQTMSPIYQKHPLAEDELHALVAYLVSENEHEVQASGFQIKFFGLGIVGTIASVILFSVIWRNRFKAVRSPLVEGKNTKRIGGIR